MCRIAAVLTPQDPDVLASMFGRLEDSFGGHGNGIAYMAGGRVTIRKGIALAPETLGALAAVHTPAIYHTRQASSGDITDAHCHPFAAGPGRALAHNGHWTGYHDVALTLLGRVPLRRLVGASDTMIAAELVALHGPRALDLVGSGVWLLLDSKGVTLRFYDGDFALWRDPDGAWQYASEVVGDVAPGFRPLRPDGPAVVRLTAAGPVIVSGEFTSRPKPVRTTYGRTWASDFDETLRGHLDLFAFDSEVEGG